MDIANDLMKVLKEYSKDDSKYINPNFLSAITKAIEDYYGVEDDAVNQWVQEMFSL